MPNPTKPPKDDGGNSRAPRPEIKNVPEKNTVTAMAAAVVCGLVLLAAGFYFFS